MITIAKPAQAGTLESSDALISLFPGETGQGVQINVESIVKEQFGDQIRQTVRDFIDNLGITDILVTIKDRGALDFVLEARLETALARAGKRGE